MERNLERVFTDAERDVLISALMDRGERIVQYVDNLLDLYDCDDDDISRSVDRYDSELETVRSLLHRFMPLLTESDLDCLMRKIAEMARRSNT